MKRQQRQAFKRDIRRRKRASKMPKTQRSARIVGRAEDLEAIQRYMPSNYVASWDGQDVVINGRDNAGWTLDGYVIPRLASGMYFAKEEDPRVGVFNEAEVEKMIKCAMEIRLQAQILATELDEFGSHLEISDCGTAWDVISNIGGNLAALKHEIFGQENGPIS